MGKNSHPKNVGIKLFALGKICYDLSYDRDKDDLTLFCFIYAYNVFGVSYIFFCAEFKSEECLEKFGYFCKFKVKGQF